MMATTTRVRSMMEMVFTCFIGVVFCCCVVWVGNLVLIAW